MSKIQKAIRHIEKHSHTKSANKTQPKLGKLVRPTRARSEVKRVVVDDAADIGEDTRQFAALDSDKLLGCVEVDRESLREAGFIAPEDEERLIIDQYRQIKQPLVAHAFGKRATKIPDGHLILVSSANAGDGKTFSCINLALSLAREQDRSVLLVDADIAKAHVSTLFGIEDQPGLMELLELDSKMNLDDAILSTDVDRLSVLPAGQVHSHSTELLASNRMERLIKALTLQDPDRIVLFDSSPLLVTSEARVLATLVGQIVLVVCAGETPRDAVMQAVGLIEEGKALNLILNQVRSGGEQGYYGYGYGARAQAEAEAEEQEQG